MNTLPNETIRPTNMLLDIDETQVGRCTPGNSPTSTTM